MKHALDFTPLLPTTPPNIGIGRFFEQTKKKKQAAKKELKVTLSVLWGVLQSTGQVNKAELKEEMFHYTRTEEN